MMEFGNVGIMTFPIHGKMKIMFQTTNQFRSGVFRKKGI
jgi:hypothetical protein